MARFWTQCYQEHFQRHFQKPFDIQVFHDQQGAALKIATHDWALHGYRVYASMGLADKLVAAEQDDFGEVILLADVRDVIVPRLFVNALFFILQRGIPLGSRFAIGGIDRMAPEFVARYYKSALYFTRAEDGSEVDDDPLDSTVDMKTAIKADDRPIEDLPEPERQNAGLSKVRNGDTIGLVYQAYFIAPEEDRYLDEYGPDEFEKNLHAQKGNRNSIRRPPCV